MRERFWLSSDGLNPILQSNFQAVCPLVQKHENLQRYSVEQTFLNKHKDFAPHLDRARQVAEELYRRYPQQVSRMPAEQFVDEVARQRDIILTNEHKRWNPSATTTWRDAARAASTPAPTSAPAPTAPAQASAAPAAPVTAPAPAQARKVVVKPPAATVPQGNGGTSSASWDTMVAASLRPR